MMFQGCDIQVATLSPLDVNSFVIADSEMDFVNKTEAKCEACGHPEAFFNEVQIRSADEPATLFYCCCKCKHRWREG
jgi:DNA-directed RNA polymerase III subunit RPC11